MSLSRTEVMRCAMVMTVQLEKWCLSVCWMRLSVVVSTEAVASSSTSTLLFLSITRPRQTSCLCPMLQFSPFSVTAKRLIVNKVCEKKKQFHNLLSRLKGTQTNHWSPIFSPSFVLHLQVGTYPRSASIFKSNKVSIHGLFSNGVCVRAWEC